MIIPIGQFAGQEVEELPSDYLRWICEEYDPVRQQNIIVVAEKELKRRDHDGDHEDYEQ